jgi:hypothetical protein
MSINFFIARCRNSSNQKLFGLCDVQRYRAAYLNEKDGTKWIAVVVNEFQYNVTFIAIDHCIVIQREDGISMAKRCDGLLYYNTTIIFVELKERGALGNDWVIDGEKQLRSSIGFFEATDDSVNYKKKKAYIANKEHPRFKQSQTGRMDKFLEETGYILRIENRIILS